MDFTVLLSAVQVVLAVVLIFLVLMHSGKDAGLSGAFGVGSGSGPLGGGSLVERNLNRWTGAVALAVAVQTILLIRLGETLRSRGGPGPAGPGRRPRPRSAGRRTALCRPAAGGGSAPRSPRARAGSSR